MASTAAMQAIVARGRAAELDVYDGKPLVTPPDRYVVAWDDPGRAEAETYDGASSRVENTIVFHCVARTRDGLRDLVQTVRDTYTDWAPDDRPSSSPMAEVAAQSLKDGGPENDERFSHGIRYRFHTNRS
ncbi:hypothetical protein [Auraticoccus monumenti]|uniref:DUF3168 domain-containing protein n=1 Tax=Auraticoccus monumenti TaxID=675864 RepID=A0A1G6UK87_9ACTN|nr:hypothetical protein [Auraticoccus monumenti]SDD40977.1 hypothetical protein SAMN04489747_0891 [Auraticoccus monumenti]